MNNFEADLEKALELSKLASDQKEADTMLDSITPKNSDSEDIELAIELSLVTASLEEEERNAKVSEALRIYIRKLEKLKDGAVTPHTMEALYAEFYTRAF